jgi:hypothetical protein
MPEDFYVHDAGAFQWDGLGFRLLRETPRERIDALTLYLHKLLRSDTTPAENHLCPICGQEIKLSFEYYTEIPKELEISTECSQCNVNVYFKSNRIPPWARAVSLRAGPGFFDRSLK